MGAPVAELVVVCIDAIEEVRTQILAAKRAHMPMVGGGAGSAPATITLGHGKDGPAMGSAPYVASGGVESAAAVAALERIERALLSGIPVRVVT